MMMVDMDDLDADENPATIAYVLLAAMSAQYDASYQVGTDVLGNEQILVIDEKTERPVFILKVSPAMGDLLIYILREMGEDMQVNGGPG